MEKKHLPSIVINVFHIMTLSNADPDLNENSEGSTDLGQKIAPIGGFPYPYSPPSYCLFFETLLIEVSNNSGNRTPHGCVNCS